MNGTASKAINAPGKAFNKVKERAMSSFRIKDTTHFGIQRKMVSYMTTSSWQTVPHVTYVYEPDVTAFFDEFKKLNESGAHSRKITLNTLMLKVFVEGIKADPAVNAHIDYNHKYVKGKINVIEDINISLPWVLPNGEMMTINLRNFESKSLDEMAEYIENLSKKIENTDLNEAMYEMSLHNTLESLKKGQFVYALRKLLGAKLGSNKIKTLSGKAKREYENIPESERITKYDLEPGTITISNIGSVYKEQRGMMGVLEIIPPQIFAIGMGSVQDKPGVFEDENGVQQIGVRKMLPICLAFDHRALDFGEVVPFMRRLDDIFADPAQIHSW